MELKTFQNKPSDDSKIFRLFIEVPDNIDRSNISYVSLHPICSDATEFLKTIIGDKYASSNILHINKKEFRCIQGYYDEINVERYKEIIYLNIGIDRIKLINSIVSTLIDYDKYVSNDHNYVYIISDKICIKELNYNIYIMLFNPNPKKQYGKRNNNTKYYYNIFSRKIKIILKKCKEKFHNCKISVDSNEIINL